MAGVRASYIGVPKNQTYTVASAPTVTGSKVCRIFRAEHIGDEKGTKIEKIKKGTIGSTSSRLCSRRLELEPRHPDKCLIKL